MISGVLAVAPVEPEPVGDNAQPDIEPELEPEPIEARLVVVAPSESQWRSAVDAHLAGFPIEVVVAPPRPGTSMRERYERGLVLAEQHDAVGVLWIESDDDAFHLYVVRPEVRVVYVRTVDIAPEAPQAALEAVGVVTAATVGALIAGSAIAMEPTVIPEDPAPEPEPEPEPEREPKPEPEPEPRVGRFVLSAGYQGTTFVQERPWQSGGAVEAGWIWPFGLHVGAGLAFMQRVEARADTAAVTLARHPVHLAVGYGRRWGRVWLRGDGLLIVDPAERTASVADPDQMLAVEPRRVRTTVALAPRIRLGVALVWRLEAYAAVATEFWLSRARYAVELTPGARTVVVTPRWVRVSPQLGIAVRL